MANIEFIGKIALILIAASLLYSCMMFEKKDGPPPFYVDESKIPNAQPKHEKMAKYGNMQSYSVFGKRYHVMPTSQGYEAIGKASWYGTKFHGVRTSSGEPYNMLSMTAAHKTLPLPTYVEVTNLNNHKKIIVKVNDRGPFQGNRLIDLSYVAAKKLNMLGQGTTMVKIRALHPNMAHVNQAPITPIERTTAPRAYQHNIYLQVGAFKQKVNAERLKRELRGQINAKIEILLPIGFRQLYRVRIGPFGDPQLVLLISNQLKQLGLAFSQIEL